MSRFVKNIGILAGGAALSQLLLLAGAPLLTRLYSPDDFGALAIYISLTSIFSVIASLRYELAVPLPEDDATAINLVVLSLLLVILISISAGIILLLGSELVITILGVESFSEYLWILPIGIFFIGTFQVINYWSVRERKFSLISKARLFQSASMLVMQLLFSKLNGGGLIVGQAVGQGIGAWNIIRNAILERKLSLVSINGIRNAAKRYRDFPIFSTWSGLLNTLGSQFPPLLFAFLFNSAAVGIYALAHRVIAAPMSILGQAVGSAFLAEAPDKYRNGDLAPFLLKVHRRLICLIFVPVLVVVTTGEYLFTFVFGEEWRVSGEVAGWLSLWGLVSFATAPLSSIYEVAERQKLGMLMQLQLFVFRFGGVVFGAYFGDFVFTIVSFSLSNVVSYIFYLCVLFKVIGGNPIFILINYFFPFFVVSLLMLFW